MKVILVESVNHLGRSGDLVTVKAGFARNYLVPKGLAMMATKENIEILKTKQAEIDAKEAAKKKEAEALKVLLEKITLEAKVETNEEGELYGSFGVSEVAKLLAESGHVINKRDIVLPEGPVEALGEYPVDVVCHVDVIAKMLVKVM